MAEPLNWRENNFPHPAATGRHNFAVRATLISILKESITSDTHRRIVAKFIDAKKKKAKYPWEKPDEEPINLFDSNLKLGLHMAQTGRISIVYLDECIFRVVKDRRWTRKKVWGVKIMKMDLERVELTKDHMSALQGVISQHL